MRGTIMLVAVVLLLGGIIGRVDAGTSTTFARVADAVRAWDDREPTLRAERAGGRLRVRVTGGTANLDDVAAAFAQARQPHLLTVRNGTWTLAGAIVVTDGATVLVRDTELRIVGDTGLHAAGGRAILRRATVTGWDIAQHGADTDLSDGRGWLLASSGGAITADDARLANLGYDAPNRYGVTATDTDSWLHLTSAELRHNFDGAHVTNRGSARIEMTRVFGALRHGVANRGGRGITIDGANIVGSAAHGVFVEHATGTRVARSTIHANHGGGVTLRDGSASADIVGNNVFHNPSGSVTLEDSRNVNIGGNLLHSSIVGIAIRGTSSAITVAGNRVVSNRTDGVLIDERASDVAVTGNRIDFNNEAAVAVKTGAARVIDNLLTQNFDGVRLETRAGVQVSGEIRGNDITGNVQDGVDLPADATLPVVGNTIVGNREGGVSVVVSGDGRSTIARNEVRGNGRGNERVRETNVATSGDRT